MSKKTSLNKALFLTAIGIILITGGWFLMTKTKLGDPTLPQAVVDAADVTTPLTSGEQTLMAASTTPETITQTDNAAPNAAAVPPNKTAPVMQPEGRFLGRTDAPVQIIEFSSLTCSHCAYFHNEILSYWGGHTCYWSPYAIRAEINGRRARVLIVIVDVVVYGFTKHYR